MPSIALTTSIGAPLERVFDLARSIDAHVASTTRSREVAVDGVTTGLISLGESVTWEARHLGFRHRLTVRLTKMARPYMFEDEMISGPFRRMRHCHKFQQSGTDTLMRDQFEFEAPLGVFGRLAEKAFLNRYMRNFLQGRVETLKLIAESNEWRLYLHG